MTEPHYEQIAKRSYLIWEQSGRPDGRDLDHWLQAEQELSALFNPPARTAIAGEAAPQKKAAAKKAAAKKPAAAKKAAPKKAAAAKMVKKTEDAKPVKAPRSRTKTTKA